MERSRGAWTLVGGSPFTVSDLHDLPPGDPVYDPVDPAEPSVAYLKGGKIGDVGGPRQESSTKVCGTGLDSGTEGTTPTRSSLHELELGHGAEGVTNKGWTGTGRSVRNFNGGEFTSESWIKDRTDRIPLEMVTLSLSALGYQ